MKARITLSILFFCALYANAQNLVAYYPFNGNANDVSGNNNHGTVSGATLTTDRSGNVNKAYSFDGNNDVITIPQNTILNASDELSFSVWVKPDAFPSGSVMIVGKSNYANATNYLVRIKPNGYIQFEYKNFANTTDNPLILNQWNHIAVVSDAANAKKVYINGALASHNTATSPYGLVTDPVTIGAANYGAEYFKGSMDELKMFNKALTIEEIKNEYKNMVAYYPFNGNANDESGSLNHGTVNGATLTADRSGKPNSAYEFDGINDYIQCLQPGPTGTSPRTISFWAKTNVVPTEHSNVVLSYGESAGSFGYGDRIEVGLNSKSLTGLTLSVGGTLLIREFNTANQWHYYTIVYDGTSTRIQDIKMYADGKLLANTTYFLDLGHTINTTGSNPIYIGMLYGYGRYFTGSIDEVKVYDMVLSDAEILDLYSDITTKVPDEKINTKGNFYVFSNTLYFKNSQKSDEIKSIEIYNVLGKKVFTIVKIENQIPLNNLENGVYILKVALKNGSIQSMKFVVQ